MEITSVTGSQATYQDPAALSDPTHLSESFLQLLVAQLKHQNPLDPRDGAEFLGDLVQLSSLSELVSIRETMKSLESAFQLAAGGFGQTEATGEEPVSPDAEGPVSEQEVGDA